MHSFGHRVNYLMQIEQPLCLNSMIVLFDKMDKEIEDVTADINAYQTCLQRMEKESYNILSETDFQKDKQNVTMPVAYIC
jgi:beclin